MQRILTIKIGKGKILSKPWCFEALCTVDDSREANSAIGRCMEAVRYLFEGTKATDEFLKGLGYARLNELCRQVWKWYISDIRRLLNIQKNIPQESGSGKMRDLYTSMFKAWGILGDELGKQRPEHIFLLLEDEDSGKMQEAVSDASRVFYGF